MITEENESSVLTNCSSSNTLTIDSKSEIEVLSDVLPKQPQQSFSKIEALTKDDLIKLVKKQLINQKELKKQLETSKNQCDSSANKIKELSSKITCLEKDEGTSMLLVELEDYKNASVIIKKELQDCKEKLTEKEALVKEFSQHMAILQEEKAETNKQLHQKSVESAELKQSIIEKSNLIEENSKEISSLIAQLNDSRQQMLQEISLLNETLLKNSTELKAEQRANSARSAELKRLKCENDTLETKLKNFEEEFKNYKERAEFVFKSSKVSDPVIDVSSHSTTETPTNLQLEANIEPFNGELDQLLELLKQRNVLISQIRTKCSFLEEEVKNSQEYSKTLLEELNALHDSISQIRRQSQMERQRIIGEFEQKLKKEEALRNTFEYELKIANERDIVANKNIKELKVECERLQNELEEIKKKLDEKRHVMSANSPTPPQHFIKAHNQQERKSSISTKKNNIQQKQIPKPLKLAKMTNLSQVQRSSFEEDFINRNTLVDDDAATMNSESLADSLDDLQSMLREAEIEPISEITSFNVAELPSDSLSVSGGMQRIYYSHEEYNELMLQLNSCRELLSESEEETRRLERNQHRAKQLGDEVCSEYFKNIILKFLTPPRAFDERPQLLPVLQTILHLDEKEMEMVRANYTDNTVQSFSTSLQGSFDNQKGEGSGFASWLRWN